MKIEDMTFDQLNACFSLLINLIRCASGNPDSNALWQYLIVLEKQVGTAMNARIDEMINEGRQ